jgi:hypothetical protein
MTIQFLDLPEEIFLELVIRFLSISKCMNFVRVRGCPLFLDIERQSKYTFGMSQGYDSVKPLDLSLATLFFGYPIVLCHSLRTNVRDPPLDLEIQGQGVRAFQGVVLASR